ncbi:MULTISPECIES: ribonuclease R [unclassified Streptococcus]|uniref:ribonuclease R n=1 Tax=unclassified Streptococcus TaxID=2608887 RepID=UPI0010717088|nr:MULTISPECIES: ribonuclease R [unclassified Streptococcus]MBF0787894.1 ribonuclease R [Streptococcus sp. 19428wC2_LYSM12]MCQ9212161.1 ribonuclease R [Streptococcus sp. B01]MCQ9213491.1 ribonuclease R [Streptococcus sp. O1]TFV05077.1 ribonuclease R [Streptococcus sp. LYSM12]
MKKEIINYIQTVGPVTMNQLADYLQARSAKEFVQLVKQVSNMERRRQLCFDSKGRIALPEKKSPHRVTLTGIFRANKNGFGFVTVDETEDDIFIGRNDVNHAIEGDKVEVAIKKVADRFKGTVAEAEVIDILEHSLKTAVGQVIFDEDKKEYAGYIKSKNQKISQPIYLKKSALVLDGTEIVKVAIEQYPNKKRDYFVATILDVIGHKDDVGIDVLEVLESMDIVAEFPDDVLAEANRISDHLLEKDYEDRLDLRQEIIFTIDGADAKDLDDAVHIKQLKNGNLELGVHIADVSYYVTDGSALDREALNRGTSVYVTDRVVPMLPERLSNGICSLNPNVDRLTQSAIMEIDHKGRVVKHWIGQTVINTTYRMTYADVNLMIAGDKAKLKEFSRIVPSVEKMVRLHETLETMRFRRGALNFDTNEAKIIVNKDGMPVDIQLRQRGIAERMIESFMLIANETVAEHFSKLDLPFIYRVHEEPKVDKLQKFIDYASSFGVGIAGTASSISSESLQALMNRVADEPYADVLNMMLLRSMQQARYSEHNHGHYGLGADYYTHFTSPIRRYPDLLVHRMVREYSTVTPEVVAHFEASIPAIAKQTSNLERRAIDAEREVEAMKKAEYMQEFVGQEFDGVVSSIVKFGLFVELPNTVEGLIHIQNLPEFYQYNERTLTLKGEKSGRVFRVGQAIRVKLMRADKLTGEIDFAHLPSDMDVLEPPLKAIRKSKSHANRDRSDRTGRGKGKGHKQEERAYRSSKNIPSKDKKKKPFYKEVAKTKRKKRR